MEGKNMEVYATDAFKKEAYKAWINGIIFLLFAKVQNKDQYDDVMDKLTQIRDTKEDWIRFTEKSFAEGDATWVVERLAEDGLWDEKKEIIQNALDMVASKW